MPKMSKDPVVVVETACARVCRAAPVARLALRARGDLAPLNAALGVVLPRRIGARTETGARQVICLGPDEWMLHLPPDEAGPAIAACAQVYADLPHSLVDVSGREVTFVLDGPRVEDLLSLGLARDIDSVPVGEGRRTIFDGATVILWRDGQTEFRMDCWHSFAPYLLGLLETGCKELAAEVA